MKLVPTLFRRVVSSLALMAAVSSAAVAAPSALYTQAPDYSLPSYLSVASAQSADSFSLGSAFTMTGLQWWGSALASPISSGFEIRLYGDLAASLTSDGTVLPIGAVTVSPAGNYSANFITPESLLGGTTYYISIWNNNELWGWQSSSGFDDQSAFRGQSGTEWDFSPPDLAFAVIGERDGQEVPEPPLWALLSVTAVAAASASRRRPRA